MRKKYEIGMILILKPSVAKLSAPIRRNKWILRKILKEPVDNCRLICENIFTGTRILFREDDFTHRVDTDALLILDCEAKSNPKN